MKKTEIILLLFSLTALSLKCLLVPGGSFLTVISLSALSVFYLYLSFALLNGIPLRNIFEKISYKGISTKRIMGSILTGMALSSTIIGLIFKVQSWPGSTVNLLAGLMALLITLIVVGIKYFRTKADFYVRIIERIAILGGLALIVILYEII